MDFVTFVKEKKRMCDTFHDCDRGCPLFGLGEPFEFCSTSCMKQPEKAQEIVELWSEQNPENLTQKLLSEFRDNIFKNFEIEMEIRRHSTYGGLIDGFTMYAIRRIINTELERMMKK